MFAYQSMHKRARRAHVWSNIFFVAPIILAFLSEYRWYGVLLVVTVVVSVLFHLSKQKDHGVTWLTETKTEQEWLIKRLLWLDTSLGFLMSLATAQLIISSGFLGGFSWLALITALFAITAFLIGEFSSETRRLLGYNYSHAMWHFWAAITALLAVLAAATVW